MRVTAGVLLGPMIVTGALVLAGPLRDFAVPDLLGQTAFALIGLQVGLRFTPATVRLARRLLPFVFASIVGLVLACAVLAEILELLAGVTYADAYLATTPGGLYAVLATALDGGGEDPAFVFAVQALRLLVMVLAAPLMVRLLVPARAPRAEPAAVE
jgi:membrane AbrB-like protein